ncbi:RagB/SusD family nutrient uptake outer membrane protein [Alistipes sp. ZOR0009]|uniref:RagB/SusD family nutrient uptake outer membrane protein n=1 Tax=Alistipes sp. ZOR0009 TaxID=1339253 RepID=UPI000645FC4B|nr:RagB/SusD family nutrient uptake outer membrane protein [Alistipes sp. ZOR0009]
MNKLKYLIVLATILVGFSSCTDSFDDYNRNSYGVTDELKKADWIYLKAYFPQMEQSIYYNNSGGNWEWQVAQNLNSDLFGGYLTPPTAYNNDKNNINYFMMEGWNKWAFNLYNNNIMKPWLNVKKLTYDEKKFLDVYGVALILKVAGMHRCTDLYGPIPYSKYGAGTVTSEYDSQEAIYNQFFAELDEAIGYLDAHLNGPESAVNRLGAADYIYKGNYKKWIQWANSLRLRLAIRISKVNPAKAKLEGEKAMANPYGIIERNSQNVTVPTGNMGHPLSIIAYDYNDTRMSADMESILTGLKDPRIERYFTKATDSDPNIKGQYRGIRQGIYMTSKDLRVKYSNLGEIYKLDDRYVTPVILMTASEVYFLRAEGALRGWSNMGGTPSQLYQAGVETSMGQWDVSGTSAYLNDGSSTPANYVDYKNSKYNAPAASHVTVKWDESASNEVKLEKIITQKWIAMFPEGAEAWSEFRRTGYPKLFPIVENNSNGEISSTVMIRRLRFPEDEYNYNKTEVLKAIQLLKGAKDSPGVQLWWDTNTGVSNF